MRNIFKLVDGSQAIIGDSFLRKMFDQFLRKIIRRLEFGKSRIKLFRKEDLGKSSSKKLRMVCSNIFYRLDCQKTYF